MKANAVREPNANQVQKQKRAETTMISARSLILGSLSKLA